MFRKKVAFIVINIDKFFLTNRKEQAQAMVENGYEVHIVAQNTGYGEEIRNLGFIFHELPSQRFGLNPLKEVKALFFFRRLYKQYKPEIIHHLGLKPILMGSIASLSINNKYVFNTYTGLGYVFIVDTFKTAVIRNMLLTVFYFLYKRKDIIAIFQNTTDFKLFKQRKIVSDRNGFVIKGCGVDINEFRFAPAETKEVINVLLPGKLLRSKGVYEFVDAARILKKEWGQKVDFVLCGGVDHGHPSEISENEVDQWVNEGVVKWPGHQSNMQAVLKDADIIVLPSFREGLPKSLLEAGAIGRPMVTYDVAGCNEVVREGVNGLIVPPHQPAKLAIAIRTLIGDSSLRLEMGRKAREITEKEFAVDVLVEQNLQLYRKIKEHPVA